MPHIDLSSASTRAMDIRARYEIMEERLNGRVWSLHELMLGFANDVGYVGRLLLAHDGTWDIDGDAQQELEHKLAESLWWVFVLADRFGIDISTAYSETMDQIATGLDEAIAESTTA